MVLVHGPYLVGALYFHRSDWACVCVFSRRSAMPGVWSKLTPGAVGRIPVGAAMNTLSGVAMCLWIGHFLKRYAQRQKR